MHAALIIFDSFQQPAFAGARGATTSARQLVLRTAEFDIHVKIWEAQHRQQLVGQMMPHPGYGFSGSASLCLLLNGERLKSVSMNDIGEFYFEDVPEGDLSLQIDLPHLTVIGELRRTSQANFRQMSSFCM